MTMKGLWVWSADQESQVQIIDRLRGTAVVDALMALSKNKTGLSNAQLDMLMDNSSQWNSLSTLSQLLALGFAEYRVNIFGDSGKYLITELGQDVLNRLAPSIVPFRSKPRSILAFFWSNDW